MNTAQDVKIVMTMNNLNAGQLIFKADTFFTLL